MLPNRFNTINVYDRSGYFANDFICFRGSNDGLFRNKCGNPNFQITSEKDSKPELQHSNGWIMSVLQNSVRREN